MVFATLTLGKRIRQISAMARTTPFDTSTPEGRSLERFRRAVWTSAATLGAKLISLATVLISVPLTVHYLGVERYGMWMTITATMLALSFADLGMGTGLMNAISVASGRDDRSHMKTAVSSAFFMLLGIAIMLGLALALCYGRIPWGGLFNVRSGVAAAEAGPAVAVFLLCFAANLPLGVVQRIQMGFQEGFQNNLWQSLGSVLGLASVIVAIKLKAGLPYLVAAMSGGPVVAALLNSLVQFRRRPWLRPAWRQVDRRVGRALIGSGLCFTLLTLMNMLGTQSDSFIIARYMGLSAVSVYAVVVKLFALTAVFEMFLAPFWPAFGEAVSRGDYAWARNTLNRLTPLSIGAAVVLSLPLVFVGKQIIALWVGAALTPATALLASYAAWSVVLAYRGLMSAMLNNEQFLRHQAWFFSVASVVAFGLKFPLVRMMDQSGAVWATVIGYTVFYAWPARVVAGKRLAHLQKEQQAGLNPAANDIERCDEYLR